MRTHRSLNLHQCVPEDLEPVWLVGTVLLDLLDFRPRPADHGHEVPAFFLDPVEHIADLLQHLRGLLVQGGRHVLLGALEGQEALRVGLVGIHQGLLHLLEDLVELAQDRRGHLVQRALVVGLHLLVVFLDEGGHRLD